jgi:hypothetical protein
MANTFHELKQVENVAGKIVCIENHGRKTLAGFGNQQEFTHYEAIGEKVAEINIYVANARKASPAEFQDVLIVKGLKLIPYTYMMNNNRQVGLTIIADSVEVDKNANKELPDTEPFVQKLDSLSRPTLAYISENMDIKGTFGEFLFMSAVPVYMFANGKRTNEITEYEVNVVPTNLNTQFTFKCLDTELDYSQFKRMRSKVEFDGLNITGIFLNTSDSERNAVEVALSAQNMKLTNATTTPTPNPTQPKTQPKPSETK